MARIAGITLPPEKRIEIGLTYIFGIGRSKANMILQEVQAGYMMGKRVLRPAKVIVSRAE